jgi:drug/metabolite transporter (DMT)-like permease
MAGVVAQRAKVAAHDRRGRALVALSVAMLAWGVTGVVAKSVDMGGMALAAYRTTVGAVVLIAAMLVTGRRVTWADVRTAAPGGVFLGLDLVFFFSAVKLTTVANATVIGALQPALVILISAPLLKEKVAKGAATWALVGLGGTVLVIFGAAGLPAWSVAGDALAALTLLVWTGYFVASRMARGRMGALEYSTITAVVASLVAWPAAAVFRQDLSWPDWTSWGWIILLAVVAGVGGHFLMSVSIPHLPLWASSTMTLSIPVISTVTAAIFLDEAVTAVQALGMAVVLIALGFAIRVSSAEVAEVPAVPAVPEAADVAAGPAVPAPPAS